MLFDATCHALTPGVIENMYPKKIDDRHCEWIKDLIHAPGNHPGPVGQLVISACECAIQRCALQRVSARSVHVQGHGSGRVLAKYIRMNDL